MADNHPQIAQNACDKALAILKLKKLKFRPMRRRSRVNTKRGFIIRRTNLKTGLITIDIWTPKKREPKKISSILRTLCHEAAHHQKKPFYERHKGRWIIRRHYPDFYAQVNKNINKLKKSDSFKTYFNSAR